MIIKKSTQEFDKKLYKTNSINYIKNTIVYYAILYYIKF